MEDYSVFHNVAVLRDCSVEQVIDSELAVRSSVMDCTVQVRANLSIAEGLQCLRPLVWSRTNRYLLFVGDDGGIFVLSNDRSGSGITLVEASALRLRCKCLSGLSIRERMLMERDGIAGARVAEVYYTVMLRSGRETMRSISCVKDADGSIYWANAGELLPFENPENYRNLKHGVVPPRELIWEFLEWFGWPSPWTAEFPSFIRSCTCASFSPFPGEQETPLSPSLQDEMLRLPEAWK